MNVAVFFIAIMLHIFASYKSTQIILRFIIYSIQPNSNVSIIIISCYGDGKTSKFSQLHLEGYFLVRKKQLERHNMTA